MITIDSCIHISIINNCFISSKYHCTVNLIILLAANFVYLLFSAVQAVYSGTITAFFFLLKTASCYCWESGEKVKLSQNTKCASH